MRDLHILESAHIASNNSVLIDGGEGTTEIGCLAFLFSVNGENVLIDTGIENIETVNRTKSSRDNWKRNERESDITSALLKCGVSPDSISKVLLTHSHYDHFSGICHFKNAEIFMSEREYHFLTTDNPHKPFLKEQTDFINHARLHLIENDGVIADGISAVCVGGHTPGSVMYTVGDTLFTGDNIFLLNSITANKRIGFRLDDDEALRALEICRSHRGTILTSHDRECLKCFH